MPPSERHHLQRPAHKKNGAAATGGDAASTEQKRATPSASASPQPAPRRGASPLRPTGGVTLPPITNRSHNGDKGSKPSRNNNAPPPRAASPAQVLRQQTRRGVVDTDGGSDDGSTGNASAAAAQRLAVQWSLPATTKNFSKALRQSIGQKLEAARSSSEALIALDQHCRRIIHDRVAQRTAHDASSSCGRQRSPSPAEPPPLLQYADHGGAYDGMDDGSDPVRNPSTSKDSLRQFLPSERREAIRRRQAEETRKGDAVRMRKDAMERQFFEEVVRAHDNGPEAVAARWRWWRTVVKTFGYIAQLIESAAVAQTTNSAETLLMHGSGDGDVDLNDDVGGDGDGTTTRHVYWRAHDVRWLVAQGGAAGLGGPRCGSQSSKVGAPGSKDKRGAADQHSTLVPNVAPQEAVLPPRQGWKLLRASIVLNWRYRLATRNVAVDRVRNMLEGAMRMATFHRAMAVFRRRLLLCQRAVRNHLTLQAARRVVLQRSWDNAVGVYRQLLFDKFDARKKYRAAIAKAREDAAKLSRMEFEERNAADLGSPASQTLESPGVSNVVPAAVPAATFFLREENSFYFVRNSMAALQSSVDISFGGFTSDEFSCDALRKHSFHRQPTAAVADESVWRPLEFKRRQSAILEASMLRDAEVDKMKKKINSPIGSPVGTASPASPASSSFGSTAARDTTTMELVRCADDAELPARRVQNVMGRCWAFLHDVNAMHAAGHSTQLLAYRVEFEQATAKRKRKNSNSLTPLPKVPRPRFRKGVVAAAVMLAFVKNEFDEHIMRSFTAQAKSSKSLVFPELPGSARQALDAFRADERRVQRWKREVEAVQRKRAEDAREVEPLLLPSVSRKDTMRVIVKPSD